MTTKPQLSAMLAGRKEMEQALITKAWGDPVFKGQLMKDPRGAIKQALGFDMPPGVSIQVIEEKPNVLTLALPAAGADQDELSDLELELVAGGKNWNGPGHKSTQMARAHEADQ